MDAPTEGPQYTAYRKETLSFHADMTRYVKPPEFTVIRCLVPDTEGGGDNVVLHIDDILDWLNSEGRQDIVSMLSRKRLLNVEARHVNAAPGPAAEPGSNFVRVPIAVGHEPRVPSRLFDRHAATKGSHLTMSQAEEGLLDEFVDACAEADGLGARIRLESQDLIAFSNWRMLHARLACIGSGRVTEICMGNVGDDEGWML